MAEKMIKCKACGEEIAASAKTCPKCGAKNKKPIYKKWWFYALIVIVIIAIAVSGNDDEKGGKSKTETKQEEQVEITYTHYDAATLFQDLKSNAMKAEKTHKDEYVEVEGKLGTIDSDGKYIAVEAAGSGYDYLFDDIQCFFKNDEQRDQVMEMNKGDSIVVRGKITEVGEILGYSLKIDSIN